MATPDRRGRAVAAAAGGVRTEGHAVEVRLYAEDPERGFLPSTGRLTRLRFPVVDTDLRVDAGVAEGDEVTVHYDPMIAKLIAWGPDRRTALDRLRDALERTVVEGVRTNARYLWEILGADAVREGRVSTRLLEQSLTPVGETEAERADAWCLAAAARLLARGALAGNRVRPGRAPADSGWPGRRSCACRSNSATNGRGSRPGRTAGRWSSRPVATDAPSRSK